MPAPEPDRPTHLHARLISFYRPVCEAQAVAVRAGIAAGLTAETPPVAVVTKGEYSRFPLFEAIDWRPAFARPRVTHFFEPSSRQRNFDRIPIGAYPDLCARLAAAAGALNEQVTRDERDPVGSAEFRQRLRGDEGLATTLTTGTVLGYSYNVERGVSGLASSVYRTRHVSNTSTAQGIAALAMYHVDGFDDGVQLAAAIVADGVLNEIGELMPPNLLGPSCREGYLFPEPVLVPSGDGHVALAPEFRSLLEAEKARFLESVAKGGAHARAEGRGQVGQGCPMARGSKVHASGIDMTADVFMECVRTQPVEVKGENRCIPGLS